MVGISVLIWAVLFSTFKGNDPYAEVTWNYDPEDSDKGPEAWDGACKMENNPMQSPVNIITAAAVLQLEYKNAMFLEFINYGVMPATMTLTNEGNAVSLKASYDTNKTPCVKFKGTIYNFDKINFHWGKYGNTGTEHAINNIRKGMEIQLQHKGPGNKLLVAAYLLNATTPGEVIPGMLDMTDNLNEVSEPGTQHMEPFQLEEFLPRPTTIWKDFYWYKGSLTMPPCTPDVVWCVRDTTYCLGEMESWSFRYVKDGHDNQMSGNVRKVQERKELVVTHIRERTQLDYSEFMEGYETETSKSRSVRMSRQIILNLYVTSMAILFAAI